MFYCYRAHIFFFTRDLKLLSAALTTRITRIKEKSHEIFIQLGKIDIPIKNHKKMLYFIHLHVALSNKYTTHALDKLKKNEKLVTDQQTEQHYSDFVTIVTV